jgi:hypothetical protein
MMEIFLAGLAVIFVVCAVVVVILLRRIDRHDADRWMP